jgi:20S proteasome alpha/beta subunit
LPAQQPIDEVENIAKDIINSIAERDIYTGDQVELIRIEKTGITSKREAIRRD